MSDASGKNTFGFDTETGTLTESATYSTDAPALKLTIAGAIAHGGCNGIVGAAVAGDAAWRLGTSESPLSASGTAHCGDHEAVMKDTEVLRSPFVSAALARARLPGVASKAAHDASSVGKLAALIRPKSRSFPEFEIALSAADADAGVFEAVTGMALSAGKVQMWSLPHEDGYGGKLAAQSWGGVVRGDRKSVV